MVIKKKILVVDDEQSLLRILKIKLTVCGYDVVTAFNGKEALRIVACDQPDMMLLDIVMPGIDGFDVLHDLKPGNKIPVIVFSAKPENATKALTMGASDFVSKPFDVDNLVNRIQHVLEHSR